MSTTSDGLGASTEDARRAELERQASSLAERARTRLGATVEPITERAREFAEAKKQSGAERLGGAAAAEGWSGPSLDERVHHLMAHWPDVKLHWYGKGQRPGRKLGHVTALGDDLAEVRARAAAAARYLADGVVEPAFAFEEEHA